MKPEKSEPSVNPSMERAVVLGLLLLFVALGASSVRGKTSTFDEARHERYGMNILEGDSDRFDDSKMPVSALNALPAWLAGNLPAGASRDLLESLFAARMVTLLVSASVALLVFSWARSLYGFVPGVFAMTLYILDPNILAHSQLVTTDLYALGSVALVFFRLWRFARERTPLNGLLCALALGLSQLAKYSCLALYGLSLASLVIYDLPRWRRARGRERWIVARPYLGYLVTGLTVSLLVINLGFLFNRTFTRFGDYSFRSDVFRALQTDHPALDALPVPVPYPYLEGLDWVIQREQSGEGYGKIYLLGQLRNGKGFPGYYFIASLLKTPLASQILVAAALILYALRRDRLRNFSSQEVFLLLPVLFYVIYFNFFYNAQIGIRYYLVIFPLLYIFTGGLFQEWARFSAWRKSAGLGLAACLAVSVFAHYPYYLSYFNELVRDQTQTYKYLADSNLDWGQSRNELDGYFRAHPGAAPPPARPESGEFVISANRLVGITADPARFAWLRENFEPVDTVAGYYFVYRISPEEIDALCRTTAHCTE